MQQRLRQLLCMGLKPEHAWHRCMLGLCRICPGIIILQRLLMLCPMWHDGSQMIWASGQAGYKLPQKESLGITMHTCCLVLDCRHHQVVVAV